MYCCDSAALFHFTYYFIFAGLLTVDPKRRLRMTDLLTSEWIQGSERAGFATVPLMTPDVLTAGSSARSAEINVAQTFSAFHQAHREGFRLQVGFTVLFLSNKEFLIKFLI